MSSITKNLIEITGTADSLPENPTVFKQLTVRKIFELPEIKPDIGNIFKIIAKAVITDTRVIKTPVGKSLEGQTLTGYKLIVEGELCQKFEYTADDCEKSVHAAFFNIPFCSFIILPVTYKTGMALPVTGYIEDISAEDADKRTVYENVSLLLDIAF
jgi:hypothetical protein